MLAGQGRNGPSQLAPSDVGQPGAKALSLRSETKLAEPTRDEKTRERRPTTKSVGEEDKV